MKEDIKEHPFSTDTVEKHMVGHACAAAPDDTVADFLNKLNRCTSPAESLEEIYVTDENHKLIGAIPLNILLKSNREAKLAELMRKEVIAVHPHTDRERAGRLAIHNELAALPVIDKNNRLVGVLPSKSTLRLLHEENIEDMLRAAGYRHAHKGAFIDVLKARVGLLIRTRTPWLVIGLFGGMAAAWISSLFKTTIEKNLVIAFFIPAVVYMAAAVGTQTEALFLRLYDTGGFKLKSYLWREIQVGFGIGIIASTLIFLYTLLVFKKISLAFTIGLSMFITIFIAVFIATFIPTIIVKFKRDPAVGSGPFATAIQDILSLVIYFVVASLIL